jgi:hypothetical protein
MFKPFQAAYILKQGQGLKEMGQGQLVITELQLQSAQVSKALGLTLQVGLCF